MINHEYLTFLVLSRDEEQLLWCVKNIRYKNKSKVFVCHNEQNKVVKEICSRYNCQIATSLHDMKERFKLDPTRHLIVINDRTRVSQIDYMPNNDIIGSLEKGCLILARSKVNSLDHDLVGEDWHDIKDVSGKEWWNYPKEEYPILHPCELEDARCKFSPT